MSARLLVPAFGRVEGRFQALLNPLAELDFDLGNDDQLD